MMDPNDKPEEQNDPIQHITDNTDSASAVVSMETEENEVFEKAADGTHVIQVHPTTLATNPYNVIFTAPGIMLPSFQTSFNNWSKNGESEVTYETGMSTPTKQKIDDNVSDSDDSEILKKKVPRTPGSKKYNGEYINIYLRRI